MQKKENPLLPWNWWGNQWSANFKLQTDNGTVLVLALYLSLPLHLSPESLSFSQIDAQTKYEILNTENIFLFHQGDQSSTCFRSLINASDRNVLWTDEELCASPAPDYPTYVTLYIPIQILNTNPSLTLNSLGFVQ